MQQTDMGLDIKEHALKNGIKVITVKRDTNLPCLFVTIKAGSFTGKKRGVAHFAEHLLFQGTKKRNSKRIEEDFDLYSHTRNGLTGSDETVYYTQFLNEYMEKNIELLSDIIINPVFPKEQIEIERDVIISESNMYQESFSEFVNATVYRTAFKNHPNKVIDIGTESDIRKIKRRDILSFYKSYYTPNNTFILLISRFTHEEMLEKINNHFRRWKREGVENRSGAVYTLNKPGKYEVVSKGTQQCYVNYFCPCKVSQEEELVAMAFKAILWSRLNDLLRKRKGICYSVDCTFYINNTGHDKSELMFGVSCLENQIEDVEVSFELVIKQMLTGKFNWDKKTKKILINTIKSTLYEQMEDTYSLGQSLRRNFAEGQSFYERVEYMDQMHKINKKDIVEIGKRILECKNIYILKPMKAAGNNILNSTVQN